MPISNMLPWIILLSLVAFTAWWIFRPSARTRKTDSRVIMASTLLVIMSGSFVLWQSGFQTEEFVELNKSFESDGDEIPSDSDCGGLVLAKLCLDSQSLENMDINAFFESMSQIDGGENLAASLICGSNESCFDAASSCIEYGCDSESLIDFVNRFQSDGDKVAPKIGAPLQSKSSSPSAKQFDDLREALQAICRLNANPFSSAPSQLTVWEKIKELLKQQGRPPKATPANPPGFEPWNFPGVPGAKKGPIETFLAQVDRFFKAKKISDALKLLEGLKTLFSCATGACDGEYRAICEALNNLEKYLKEQIGENNPIPQDVIDNFKELLKRLLEDKKDPIQ